MKIFPFNEKLCLPNSYLKEYTETMSYFQWELENFCINKYIIEKIRDFPFHLFGDAEGNIFFNAVANTFLNMCIITAYRLSNDKSKDAYPIKKFQNTISKNIKEEYLKQFSSYLKEIDFNKKLDFVAEKTKNIRDKALAHVDAPYVKNKLSLKTISWKDFDTIENNLIITFNGLFFDSERMLLPISYNPRIQPSRDIDSRPDIVKILDCIAKESDFLNLPEDNFNVWKIEIKKISKEDLEIFNCYRRKNNLKKYQEDGFLVDFI
jgi:hypothetical protein